MSQRLTTFFKGASGASRATLNLGVIQPHVIQQRRRQCADCPHATRTKSMHIQGLTVLTPTSTCRLCKCNLHLKTKLAGESCPAGVWVE